MIRYAFAFAVATVLAACNAGGLLIVEDAGEPDAGGGGAGDDDGGATSPDGAACGPCSGLENLNCGFYTRGPTCVCGVVFFDAGTYCAPGRACDGAGDCLPGS
jgi:hypothetical protein